MARQTRVGGLPGFVVRAENLQVFLKELKALEPNLRKELVSEMKRDVQPIGKDLLSKIPGPAPLSGFSPAKGDSPYIWRKPRMTVKTPFAKRAKKPGTFPVVSIQFNDRRPNAGLSILELAGTANIGKEKGGLTQRGRNIIKGLNTAGYPIRKGLGRFVIPEFKEKQNQATRIAVGVLERYAAKVNRRLK